jgi:hypothetical protein
MAVGTPRSAWTRASSSSSSVASSSLRLVKRPVTLSERDEDVRRMPSVRRCHQPRAGLGLISGAGEGRISAGAGSGAGRSAAAMSGRSSGPASVTMRGSGSCGLVPSGSRPSTGWRSAPASSGGVLSSSVVSGEAVVTVGGAAVRSSAAFAGGEGIVSGWPPARGVSGAGSGTTGASALRPNRRERNPGLSGLVSAMGLALAS